MTVKHPWSDILVTLLCLIGIYFIYTNLFLNSDVAWHIEGARRMLAGGDYLTNMFDTNSPFVFAYFIPMIFLREFVPFSYPHLAILYIIATSLIPLSLCYRIINKAYQDKELLVKRLIYYVVVFIILFLPAFHMGQRETILIYCYLPNFFLVVFSTTYPKAFSYSKKETYPIVLLATFGICQNIFYLSIPIFLDLYSLLKTKKIATYQVFFYICIFFSILLVSFLYPNYVRHIVPMVLCYESGFNFPLLTLLLEILTFICLLTMTIVLINMHRLHKSDDIVMCFIAAICSLLIYFFEKKLWYYHLYPALCFVLLILIFLIIKYYEETFLKLYILPHVTLFEAAMSSAILITIIFIIGNFFIEEWRLFHNPQEKINQWIQYVKNHFENKKLYFFVIKLSWAYSPLFYSNANIKVVSPWSNPWMLPYIILNKSKDNKFCFLRDDIKIFQSLAAKAISQKQPDFIIIEETPAYLVYHGTPFGYINFFSENEEFKHSFAEYSVYDYFDKFIIYKKHKTE